MDLKIQLHSVPDSGFVADSSVMKSSTKLCDIATSLVPPPVSATASAM